MIVVGRDTCRSFEEAITREWLVTNGIGGYASGTVAGPNTRRYHGLLVAALDPPRERTVLLARVDEEVVVDDRTFYLGSSEFQDGTVNPNGYIHLQECRIEDGIPSFVFEVPGAMLTKTIWMEDGQNTTYVRYALDLQSEPIALRVALHTTFRDFHHETHGSTDWIFATTDVGEGVEIAAYSGAAPLRIRTQPASRLIQTGVWYWRYLHRRERERGLDCVEDLYTPGLFVTDLQPGASYTVVASTEDWPRFSGDTEQAAARRRDRQRSVWATSSIGSDAVEVRDLVVAADQFVVRSGDDPDGGPPGGIVAGYHWFGEWGRDALIALPGIMLANGRYAEAKRAIRHYAGLVDHGQIPNRLPDQKNPPEYNAVDASLWFFQAIERYLDATRDDDLLAGLLPTLDDIIQNYQDGTRFGIGVDANDGLLLSGAPGVQLTWMDAKVGEWVVTPRHGKAVEVNALWYNALRLIDGWSRRLNRPNQRYGEAAHQAYESFNQRFWNPESQCLYDVVDGDDGGDDPAVRPNQLFAIGLVYPTLDPRRWDSTLDVVESELLTQFGLRSLAPSDAAYQGYCRGDQRQRDGAYHQGTIWPWLIGIYADACRRAGRDLSRPRSTVNELLRGMSSNGLGSIAEIFDGDAPNAPGGCIAQAWSVAEVLRAWIRLNRE
jgi:predicted glycogen debranching enzyme